VGDHGRHERVDLLGLQVEGAACERLFVTSQGSAFMRFRRTLDHCNVTEALAAASGSSSSASPKRSS
jgi:hypothetical protein